MRSDARHRRQDASGKSNLQRLEEEMKRNQPQAGYLSEKDALNAVNHYGYLVQDGPYFARLFFADKELAEGIFKSLELNTTHLKPNSHVQMQTVEKKSDIYEITIKQSMARALIVSGAFPKTHIFDRANNDLETIADEFWKVMKHSRFRYIET